MTRKRPDVQPCGERHEPYLHCLTCNPPPPERPEKLQGPEVGEFVVYHDSYAQTNVVVRVIARSYVWAPGDPAYRGGSRRYDWKVIERGPGEYRAVVVNDTDLAPLPDGMRAQAVYQPIERGY